MRPINYIFRFILFTFIFLIILLFVYFITIIGMIFINWDREYESFKEIHKEIYEWWKKIVWRNDE